MRTLLGCTICVVVLATLAAAQLLNDGSATGLPPFVGMHGGKLDVVSLQNGNLHIEIPLVTLRNKRGRTTTYRYVYDTPTWVLTRYPSDGYTPTYWNVDQGEGWGTTEGWRLVGDSEPVGVSWTDSTITCPITGPAGTTNYEVYVRSNFFAVEADGTKHPLALRTESMAAQFPCIGQQFTSPTLDGTGTFVDITNLTSPSVWTKDGTQTSPSWHDTNGNLRVVTTQPTVETFNSPRYDLIHFKNSNGADTTFRVDYATSGSAYQTNVCPLRQHELSATCYESNLISGGQPSKLTLPNGLAYTFHWTVSSNGLENLTAMDLPTGGTISYTYQGNGFEPDQWRLAPTNARSAVTSRTVTANGTSSQWTYSGYGVGTGGTTTVSNPDGSVEYHTFSTLNGLHGLSVETQVQTVQAGTTLRTVSTTYGYDVEPETSHAVGARPTSETVTLDNGLVSKTETDYEVLSGSYPSGSYTYTRMNPTEKREYGYGSGSPGALVRRTDCSYLHAANSNYANAHITDRLASKYVYDGSANLAAASQTLYDTTGVTSAGGAVQHDYTNFGTGFTLRGNPTSIQAWRNTDGAWLATTNYFDELGNLRQTQDPGGHNTFFDYTDSWGDATCAPAGGSAQLWASSSTNHLGHVIRQKRNSCTATLYSATDPNNQTTSYAYEPLDRVSQITYPDGGLTSYTYNDTAKNFVAIQKQDASANIVNTTVYDDLGREVLTERDDPEGTVYVGKAYDAFGRLRYVTNPYRTTTEPTYGVTYYDYDTLGRVTTVTEQDGNTVQTSYSGNCTTGTDETGRQRKSCSDALGRLTGVWEDPSGLNYETDYQYDVLGNLLRVDQKGDSPSNSANWRTRVFSFDSLSHLLTAANPESGTISYGYDADGNLSNKTDARGVLTTYSYDALHRNTVKTFSDGTPSAGYFYDETAASGVGLTNAVGRLTHNVFGNDVNIFSYDPMGRVHTEWELTPSISGYGSYYWTATYDLVGKLTSLTYPSGRKITDTYTSAGRLLNVTFDSFNGQPVGAMYWVALQGTQSEWWTWGYNPNGSLRSAILGNNSSETTTMNSRLQPDRFDVFRPPSMVQNNIYTWASHTMSWTDAAGHNNGNVWAVVDNQNGDATQNFSYDALNRLSNAWTTGTLWGNSYQLDAWGNLTKMQAYGTKPLGQWLDQSAGIDNRLTGYSYDVAGNLVTNGSTTYQYDAESRVRSVNTTGAVYTYDADGNRVRKDVGSDATEYIYFGGQVIAEYKPASGDWSDYVYANGKRVAKADSFEDAMQIEGTNTCTGSCWPFTWYRINDANYLSGVYTIQAHDRLVFRQYQVNAAGGMGIFFRDGTNNVWGSTDQNGKYINSYEDVTGDWVSRVVDLTDYANRVIDWIGIDNDGHAPANGWTVLVADVAIVSADGTVHPIFNGSPSVSLSLNASSGTTGLWAGNRHLSGVGWHPSSTTMYYHGDQLGTSRLMTSYFGYPVWSGTFLPFGAEFNPQTTTNHYKFTGKERDSETGLDYFGARYYGSTMGRFTSVDAPFADQHTEDPQSWNLYSYTRNNPLKYVDTTGHELKLAVYLTTSDKNKVDQVSRGAERAAQTFRDAGLKNVTVEMHPTADANALNNDLKTFPAEKDSHTLVFVAGDAPNMTDSGEFGRERPLTNLVEVNTDIYTQDHASDTDTVTALGNTMVHEGVHGSKSALGQVFNNGHTNEPGNVLNPKAPVYDPNLKLNDEQKKELQERYNRPGEEEKKK